MPKADASKGKECAKHGTETVAINMGPWTVAKGVGGADGKALAAAMGNEAWKTVANSCDFSPMEPPKGKPFGMGFTISGNLTKVSPKAGGGTEVTATFSITVDGQLSNVSLLEGKASATGSLGAEDALRAVAESRVNKLLDAIKGGRVKKFAG